MRQIELSIIGLNSIGDDNFSLSHKGQFFFSYLSIDTLVSTRHFHATSVAEQYQKIHKLMGSEEEYACFRQQGGKVVALDRNGRVVIL